MSTTVRGLLIFIGLVVFVALVCVGPAFFWLPQAGNGVGLPVITLPAEVLVPNWPFFGLDFTNTLTSLLLVDAILVVIALVVGRAIRSQSMDRFVPRGLTNFIELIGEFLYNQAYNLLGKRWTRAVFPLAASIFLFLLIGNWIKLVPGVESVGLISCAEYNVFADETNNVATGQTGYAVQGLGGSETEPKPIMALQNNALELGARAGSKATRAETLACEEKYHWAKPPLAQAMEDRAVAAKRADVEAKGEAWTEEKETEAREDYHHKQLLKVLPAAERTGSEEEQLEKAEHIVEAANPDKFIVVPFFRGMATDLNLPIALALIVVLIVQVWGIQALGGSYFFKFINIPALGNIGKKPMGAIDFLVGLIEIISELSRLVSLTFRLFGSIFAGGILLIVFSFLVAFIAPLPIYFLELFIGAIQAYVFAVLTIIYASQAVISHHGDEDHGEAHAEGHH